MAGTRLTPALMDPIDRLIINELQGGFPVCDRPYRECASRLGITEAELISRLGDLLEDGTLTRFGPLFNAGRFGGGLTLCAMQIPDEQFNEVAVKVNAFPEVAHNYQRDHSLNMWFVLATEHADQIESLVQRIEEKVGHPIFNFPKLREFFVGLHLEA